MHSVQATMVGLFLGAAAFGMGCKGGGTNTVGSSQARLVLAAKGSTPATLHVTATDDATAAVVLDKTVEVQENSASVVDLSLPPASYTFTAGALGGASGGASLGSESAQITLAGGALTQINVNAAMANGGASAQVQIGVDVAPVIKGIAVQAGAAQGEPGPTVQINVDASDAAGGALRFFWSGAGLQGAVEGSSSLTLSVAALTAAAAFPGQPVVHVVVQDAQGTCADADVTLSVVEGAVESTTTTTIGAATSACTDAQAQCNAACTPDLGLSAGANVSIAPCLAQCSLSFATCKAS
jgi:hypothetical protein